MLDIHSHVLPQMDDGSKSVQESLALLSMLSEQGVDCVAATPHFYAEQNDPARFLSRRAQSVALLNARWQEDLPGLLLGAEVHYFNGMSRVSELRSLCIEGTPLLLLEMPFEPWTDRMVNEVLDIGRRQDIKVILAHIERYLYDVPSSVWEELLDAGVLNQCNASFFLRWQTRRRALRMLRGRQIHFLGSDCHSTAHRPPRIGEALAVIGAPGQRELEQNIRRYFPALEV